MSAESMSAEEFSDWVAQLRADQGLPRHVEDPTTLQTIADLFRVAAHQ